NAGGVDDGHALLLEDAGDGAKEVVVPPVAHLGHVLEGEQVGPDAPEDPHLGDASGHRRLADALLLEGADDLSELAELDPGHRIAVLLDGGVGLALVCDGDHPIARGAGAPGEEDGKDSVAVDQADGTSHRRVTPRWEPS